MEADGRRQRLQPLLHKGAGGPVRRPRRRLRTPHSRASEARQGRQTAVHLVDRVGLLLLPLPALAGRGLGEGPLSASGLAESPPHPALRADLSPQAGRGKTRRQSRSPPMRFAGVESRSTVLGHPRAQPRDCAFIIDAWPDRQTAHTLPGHAPGAEMSDVGVAEIPVDEEERPLPPPLPPVKNAILDGPILRTLLSLAWPNTIALTAGTCVVIAETSYIGRLGVEPLAAMALVFPCVILTMTMAGGAMGGAVASAIARALGAGDRERASVLAAHALLIGICFGLVFMLGMLIFGPRLLELLGGRGNVLAHAIAYSQIFFGGAVIPWVMNTLAGILRGTGNMKLPSFLILLSASCQIVIGGALALGIGPIPSFGMRGVAAGSLIAFSLSISVMSWYLFSGRARVVPKLHGLRIQAAMFIDILKVGAIACFSPLQSVLSVGIFTHMLAQFGTEVLAGYGIGARLEFLLTSIAFAVGIASVPMVGMAIGAKRIARARRIAWIAGAVTFLSMGAIGTLLAFFPDLWVNIFTSDPNVRATSRQYLATAAPMYAFIGLSLSMYFSSQGAAKVLGPVLAQTARLVFIACGGWWLSTHDAGAGSFFMLAACSMVLIGVLSSGSVVLTRWGPSPAPVPKVRPALS